LQWYKSINQAPKISPFKIPSEIQSIVCDIHKQLREEDNFCGAQSIYWTMEDLGIKNIPSVRTINRILSRNGLLTRQKGKYEKKGTKYPLLKAEKVNQIHQMDFVGPCYLRKLRFYSVNVVDLATRRCAVQPILSKSSQNVINAIWLIWQRLGIPKNLQMDNEMSFYGSQRYPRGMGPIIRLCLANNSSPLFIPQKEPWRNGVVENFNNHYQQKFLSKKIMHNYEELLQFSLAFEQKYNSSFRLSAIKGKTPLAMLNNLNDKLVFPNNTNAPQHPLKKPRKGKYSLIRLIRSDNLLNIFGESFKVPSSLMYEYAIAIINVKEQKLLIHDSNKNLIKTYDYNMF